MEVGKIFPYHITLIYYPMPRANFILVSFPLSSALIFPFLSPCALPLLLLTGCLCQWRKWENVSSCTLFLSALIWQMKAPHPSVRAIQYQSRLGTFCAPRQTTSFPHCAKIFLETQARWISQKYILYDHKK